MSLPRAVQAPSNPLQQALYDQGFHWLFEFPASLFPQCSGFYPALAVGLLCHSGLRYDKCWKVHEEGGWRQAIGPVQAIDARYEEQLGEGKHMHPGYWQEIGAECAKICGNAFAAEFKPDMEALVLGGRVKETADKAFYDKIAGHFMAYLRIYEMADEVLRVKEFHSVKRGDFATYVNIAFDGESVLALCHQDFEWKKLTEPKFPNYTMIKIPGSEPPQINSSQAYQPPPPIQVSTLVPTMGKFISLLSRFILALQGNPVEAKNIQEALRRDLQDLEEAGRDRDDLSLDLGTVRQALEIHIAPPPAKPQDPHTVLNCEEYPEAGTLEVHHTHRFHADCLYRHLHTVSNEFINGLKCPFPACATPLAENVLEVYPDLKQKYSDLKAQTMMDHSFQSLSEIPQSCYLCSEVAVLAILLCGCKLCPRCSSNSYYANACVRCNNSIGEQDQRVISFLFEHLKTT